MTGTPVLIGAMLTLAAGTYAFRLAGPALRSRVDFPPAMERLMERAAVVLLTVLACTTALLEAHEWAGTARPAGVLVGGVMAWRKAPFLVVVLGAAGSTALLRLLGVT
ncbi:AzlD domain-containing protein [Actinomadura litoris]|uniref:AzlD domain-containing protein n=1 Tax=Actinomadura litoris TaxID=2678616 RepID=UPI001FA7B8EF|nr:AzlD domain-containing protein [Actinomadura litoris]